MLLSFRTRIGAVSPKKLDPDPVRIAHESELIARLFERLHFRSRSLCRNFAEGVTHVGDPERQMVKFLPLPVGRVEAGARRVPIEFESLRRSRTLQLDPNASVMHFSFSRDLHAHHYSVELDRSVEVSDPDAGVEETHHAGANPLRRISHSETRRITLGRVQGASLIYAARAFQAMP